jgi:KaiC/GvpD/RAD55 family RecA-like ATPase
MTPTAMQIVEHDELKRLFRGEGLVLPDDSDHGLVILIRGQPGTGKTTLAMHLLQLLRYEYKKQPAMPAKVKQPKRIFISLEQSEAAVTCKLFDMMVHRAIDNCQRIVNGKNGTTQLKCEKPEGLAEFLNTQIGLSIAENSRFFGTISKNCEKLTTTIDWPANTPEKVKSATREKEKLKSKKAIGAIVKGLIKFQKTAEYITIKTWFNQSPNEQDVGPTIPQSFNTVDPLGFLAKTLKEFGQQKAEASQNGIDRRFKKPVIVVDGLSALSHDEQNLLHRDFQSLVHYLRQISSISILAYDPLDDHADLLSHQVDMVIELKETIIESSNPYLIHEFAISRSRYQQAALGRHQFKIRDHGFDIFPSIHFQVHEHNFPTHELYRSRKTLKGDHDATRGTMDADFEGSLLDMILGGVADGESVGLFGPRNTFKRELTKDFLLRGVWGCPFAEKAKTKISHGLLLTLLDNPTNVQQKPKCVLFENGSSSRCDGQLCKSNEYSHFFTFLQRPGCISSAELLHYIKKRIEGQESDIKKEDPKSKIKRVAFWDLTQLSYRFPLIMKDRMFLTALLDIFSSNGIASVFMGAGNAEHTPALSAMVNNAVFCLRTKKDGGGDFKLTADNALCDLCWKQVECQRGKGEDPNITTDGKQKGTEKEHGGGEQLLLYVDRRSGTAKNLPDKEALPQRLWKFEIDQGKLHLPRSFGELMEMDALVNEDKEVPFVRDWIRKIVQMQGVN